MDLGRKTVSFVPLDLCKAALAASIAGLKPLRKR